MYNYQTNDTLDPTPLVNNISQQNPSNLIYTDSMLFNSYLGEPLTNGPCMRPSVSNQAKIVRFFDNIEICPYVKINEGYKSINLSDTNPYVKDLFNNDPYNPLSLTEKAEKHSPISPSFQRIFIAKLLNANLINMLEAKFLSNANESPKDKIIFLTNLINDSNNIMGVNITENDLNTMLLYWKSHLPVIQNSSNGEYVFRYDLSNYIQTLNEADIEFNISNLIHNCITQGKTGITDYSDTNDLRFTLSVLCDMRNDICKKHTKYLKEAINIADVYEVIYPIYAHIFNLYSCLFNEHIESSSIKLNLIEIKSKMNNKEEFYNTNPDYLIKKLNHIKRTTLWFKSSYFSLINLNSNPNNLIKDILVFVAQLLNILNTPKTQNC